MTNMVKVVKTGQVVKNGRKWTKWRKITYFQQNYSNAVLIWNTSYVETYAKYLSKYDVEIPVAFKSSMDYYDKEKQAYNIKNKERIKEVKINKKLNTRKMTDPDNNLIAAYVPYNKRRRTDTNVRLDRGTTPRIPKKVPSQMPSSSKTWK